MYSRLPNIVVNARGARVRSIVGRSAAGTTPGDAGPRTYLIQSGMTDHVTLTPEQDSELN